MTNLSNRNQILIDPSLTSNQSSIDFAGNLFTSNFQNKINLDFSNGFTNWDIKSFGTAPTVSNAVLVISSDSIIRSQAKCTCRNGEAVFDIIVKFSTMATGNIQRIGAYDGLNGFYFQLFGTDPYVGYKNQAVGIGQTFQRSLWIDKLDGTGPSGQTFTFAGNITKIRIRISHFGNASIQIDIPGYGFVSIYEFISVGTSSLNYVVPTSFPIYAETIGSGSDNFQLLRACASTSSTEESVYTYSTLTANASVIVAGVAQTVLSLNFSDTYSGSINNNRRCYIDAVQYTNASASTLIPPLSFFIYKFTAATAGGTYGIPASALGSLMKTNNTVENFSATGTSLVDSATIGPFQSLTEKYFKKGEIPVFQNEYVAFVVANSNALTVATASVAVRWKEII